jgi:hypothetical protein
MELALPLWFRMNYSIFTIALDLYFKYNVTVSAWVFDRLPNTHTIALVS